MDVTEQPLDLVIRRGKPLTHDVNPAVVVNLVHACGAIDVLEKFEKEVYGAPRDGDPIQFSSVFVDSSNFGIVAVMIFPRTGVDRLAEICTENGLVLIRGSLTAIDSETKKRYTFNATKAISGMTETPPAVEDFYTFGVRQNPAICGDPDAQLKPRKKSRKR